MNNKILKKSIHTYFLVAIKKLLNANKSKLVEIEKEQNLIKSLISEQKTLGLEYSEKVEQLNNKYKDLELSKPMIDFKKMGDKCLVDYIEKYNYNKEEVTKIINHTIYSFRQLHFSLSSFSKHKKETNHRYYKTHKKEETMTLKENALNTAAKKRAKSLKVLNEVIEILKQKEMKITSKNVYEIIKSDFNDCLKIRQIKTYLKEYKAQNS